MDRSYRTAWTMDEWVECLRRCEQSEWWGLDFESRPWTGIDGASDPVRAEFGSEVCGIGIAWYESGDLMSAYCPIRHDVRYAGGRQPNARMALRALSDMIVRKPPGHRMVIANAAMELSFMLAEGVCWPLPGDIHDVQVAARVLNRGFGFKELIGLKVLQQHVLGKDMESKNELDTWLISHKFKVGRDIWHAPVPIAGRYCQDDSRDALRIMVAWDAEFGVVQRPTEWWWHRAPDKTSRKDLYEMEMEVAIDALLAGLRGTRVDVALADRRARAAQVLQETCAKWIREKMGVPTLNPGSPTQLRGLLFSEAFGFEVSTAHMTDAFKKMDERKQGVVLASPQLLRDNASLDVEALEHYAARYPEHADLLFMLAVHRKCNTAMSWFRDRVTDYGVRPCPDPWYEGDDCVSLVHLIFHRLRTVGTLSGRMSSSDYNAQQIPKRFKMLIDADRLVAILAAYLPASQMEELAAMLDFAYAAAGDEAKSLRVDAGSRVVDFSIKAMFLPRPGHALRGWDLSQVEMKGFAHFSSNPMLCRGYGTPMSDDEVARALGQIREFIDAGSYPDGVDWGYHRRLEQNAFDIHKFVADQIDISRKEAKAVNFGIVYGMGQKKLSRSLGWDKATGARYLASYHSEFPQISTLQDQIRVALRKRGYIFDPFGRRYYLTPDRSYVGLNRLIQGWAAGAFKLGMVRTCDVFESMGDRRVHPVTRRLMPTGPRLLTCIHDEQLGETPVELNTPELDWAVRTCMTAVHGLRVPLSTSSESSLTSLDAARAFSA